MEPNTKNALKKTAYIHIGIPKTGTSSIQQTLRKLFRKGKLNKYNMQLLRYNEVWECVEDFWYTRDEKYFIEKFRNIILKYSKIGEKNLIISNECIVSRMHSDNNDFKYDLLPVLATALKDYNVKVIVYIRRQDIYIESLINQHIKEALFSTFNDTHFYYKELIDKCAECFNGEVIVRKYEREGLYKNDVVADFLQTIGLPDLIADYEKYNIKTLNSSLSPRSFRVAMADNKQHLLAEGEIKAKINEFEAQYRDGGISRERYAFVASQCLGGYDMCSLSEESRSTRTKLLTKNSAFSYSASNKGLFSVKERQEILLKYAEDNAAVAREYFGREDGVLFNNKMPKDSVDIDDEPTTADIIQTFMPIIIDLSQRCERLEQPLLKRLFKEKSRKLRGFFKSRKPSKLYLSLRRLYYS